MEANDQEKAMMVLLCHVPKDFGQTRREQKLRNILCRWAVRKNRRLSKMAEADRRNDVGAVSAPLGLALVNDAEDLNAVALFRERFPLGLLVTVVLNPDHDLLVSLQRYSPSFVALSEVDDAAVPQVLDQLCRRVNNKREIVAHFGPLLKRRSGVKVGAPGKKTHSREGHLP